MLSRSQPKLLEVLVVTRLARGCLGVVGRDCIVQLDAMFEVVVWLDAFDETKDTV